MNAILSLASSVLTPGVFLVAAALFVLGLSFRHRIANALNVPVRVAVPMCLSVAAILALTLGSRHYGGFADTYWLLDGALWQHCLRGDANFILNIALFVPAGFLCTRVSNRPFLSMGLLAALSLGVEHIQMWTGLGAADPADLVANTLGALIGGSSFELWLRRTSK
jgi:hypothetical protein